MKKNFLLGFIAFAAMAVTSCTNDEINEFIPQDQAIEFSTYVGRDAQSRGVETDLDYLKLAEKGFNIFGYLYTSTPGYNADPITGPNFFTGEKVTFQSSEWNYGPKKFWPKETTVKIDFLAYGPSGVGTVENGVLTFNMVNDTDASKQIDLVVAEAELEQTSTTGRPQGTVAFNFKHMLSRLGFAIEVEGAESATVTSVTFASSMNTSCTVDMKKDGSSGNNLTTIPTGGAADKSYNLTISGENKYMFIVPQTLASASVTINYEVTYPGSITTTGTATGSLPANSVFAQGTAYQIKATVTGNAIVFTASVAPWSDPETPVTVQ